VGNSEQDFTALDASADEDAAAAAAKLDRVRKQIQYDLAHRPLIRSDFGESSGKLDREANAFLPGLQRHDLDRAFNQGSDRKRFGPDHELPRLDPRHVEDAVDDGQQMLAAVPDQSRAIG